MVEPVINKAADDRKILWDPHPTKTNRKHGQNDERDSHRVDRLVSVLGFFSAGFPQESECNLPHGIESRQKGSYRQRPEDNSLLVRPCARQDLILGPEACRKHRETGEGKAADEESPKGLGHLRLQATHVEHILRFDIVFTGMQHAVFHPVDDRTRTEEQERLEESMGHQVEGGSNICPYAQCSHHITQLGYGGIRQDAFNVILRHGDGCGH